MKRTHTVRTRCDTRCTRCAYLPQGEIAWEPASFPFMFATWSHTAFPPHVQKLDVYSG